MNRKRAHGWRIGAPDGTLRDMRNRRETDDDVFARIEARIAARKAAIENYIVTYGELPFRSPSRDGWVLLVSKDPSKPTQWRVTRFEGDEPVGHTEAQTFRDAISVVYDYGGQVPVGEEGRVEMRETEVREQSDLFGQPLNEARNEARKPDESRTFVSGRVKIFIERHKANLRHPNGFYRYTVTTPDMIFNGKKIVDDSGKAVALRAWRDRAWGWTLPDGTEPDEAQYERFDRALVRFVTKRLEKWSIDQLIFWLKWNDPNGDYDLKYYANRDEWREALVESVMAAVSDSLETPEEMRAASEDVNHNRMREQDDLPRGPFVPDPHSTKALTTPDLLRAQAYKGGWILVYRGEHLGSVKKLKSGWKIDALGKATSGHLYDVMKRGTELLDAYQSLAPQYTIDGDLIEGTLNDFFAANQFDEEEIAKMRALRIGESFKGGGGGWAEYELKRVR